MEVYTAVFDSDMKEVLVPVAMILQEGSFAEMLSQHNIHFFGSGAEKWKPLVQSTNAIFLGDVDIADALAQLSFDKAESSDFTDLVYSEPFYIKEFYTP